MSVIGVNLDPIPMVLTKGRDFKWTFQNLDDNNDPTPFPVGDLFFELDTGGKHNAVQFVTVDFANGGTYKLVHNALQTADIAFDAKDTAVQAALEGVAGAGNVLVAGSYTPQWVFTATFDVPLSSTMVEGINLVVNEVFDAVEGIVGVDLDFVYDPPELKIVATSRTTLDDQGLLTFIVNTLAVAVQDAVNTVSGLAGQLSSLTEFYAPRRDFTVEFVGDLGETYIPALSSVTTGLTGSDPAVDVEVVDPGKAQLTIWPFEIASDLAVIKVESDEVDLVRNRTSWQLVFLPDGELAGGDPITRGTVRIQS